MVASARNSHYKQNNCPQKSLEPPTQAAIPIVPYPCTVFAAVLSVSHTEQFFSGQITIIMKSKIVAMLALTLAAQGIAQDNQANNANESAAPKTEAQVREEVSYAVGMDFGYRLKRTEYDFDIDTLAKAMKDVLSGSATRLTDQQAQTAIQEWQVKQQAIMEERRKSEGDKNLKAAEEFLASNGKKDEVKTLSDKLQYEVLKEGEGESPAAKDTVKVHYRGTLLDGTEFDSSYKRNEPAEFPLNGVIKGWTEGLQLMKPGSKFKFYIHPDWAYGAQGRPGIPPNALLIFEVELLEVKKAPEESVSAVSGEIIKVPSAEELKKGAKIEVLKEEDVRKLTNQASKAKN